MLNMQYLCTKKLIAGRSCPRDGCVCSEGNLATGVSACLATLSGSCHSPPGDVHLATIHQVLCEDQSEVEDEDGGCQVPAKISYCYFWKLKITMKTWIACSLFMEFTISETFSYFGRLLHMTRDQVMAVRAHSHDSLNIILKGWEQKRKTAATAPPSRGRSSGMGQQISQCFYNWQGWNTA